MQHVLSGTQTVRISSIFTHFTPNLSHRLTCTMPINAPCGFSTSCISEQLGLFFLNHYVLQKCLSGPPRQEPPPQKQQ